MIKFFKYLILGIAGLIGISIGFAVLGLALGLAVLAIKVGVVILIGYGVVKLIGGMKSSDEPQISEADRKWLNS